MQRSDCALSPSSPCKRNIIRISISRNSWRQCAGTSWSSLPTVHLGGRLFGDPVLAQIAGEHGRTVAQVALRWLLQQNVAPIPFSSKPQRIAENFMVFDFALSADDIARIAALKRAYGRIANPVGRVLGGWD